MDELQIESAKKRIFARMQARLPERGLSAYQTVVNSLSQARHGLTFSRLKLVQCKERLLDLLPDRAPVSIGLSKLFSRRVFALSMLFLFLAATFFPVFSWAPEAQAERTNVLEVASGEVFVNGSLVAKKQTFGVGDQIRTQAGAMAHLYFVDDSRITLGPDTQVTIVDISVDPENSAQTGVLVRQEKGRVWTQVLNLVSKDSYFVLEFPEGEVLVNQRASFNVEVSEESKIEVARNLLTVSVKNEALTYSGVLGQGASMTVGEDVQTAEIPDEIASDVWWDFNLAYGKLYARQLNENYKKEAISRAVILPGNPLYFLKTFRETVQETLAFTDEAKEEVTAQHAQNRLNEAQVFLAQGDTEAAEQVLEVYQETVEEGLENSDNETLLTLVSETQKEMLVLEGFSDGDSLLGDHLSESEATVTSEPTEKSETLMFSASQKLQRVPDLLEQGAYDEALGLLTAYQEESLSLLVELQEVSLLERESLVSSLLDQKLKDLQLIRVIAAEEPSLTGEEDFDAQILEQLSLMVLSLRERELEDLSELLTSTDYDVTLQHEVYSRLMEGSEISGELTEQFETVEAQLGEADQEPVVIEIETAPTPVDPRFD